MKKKLQISITVLLVSVIIFIGYVLVIEHTAKNLDSKSKNVYNILIDINEKTLYLLDETGRRVIKTYPIASGKDVTPSPIGTWTVISKGRWGGAFGARWIGLNVPWGRYGIHGTNKPNSIGSSASHGCIRMLNKDIEELYKYINVGMRIVIYGGPYGGFGNGFRVIKPGYTGSDVYEVQRVMKAKGYYKGPVNGIYGDYLKTCVVKFRKDNNLFITDDIDSNFYKKLGITLFE